VRFLLKVTVPVETGNAAINDGTLARKIEAILDEQRPEAAYFFEDNGKRACFVVIEMKDAQQIPAIAEPWFLSLDAAVEFHPVMTWKDLKKAGSGIEHAVKKFGRP